MARDTFDIVITARSIPAASQNADLSALDILASMFETNARTAMADSSRLATLESVASAWTGAARAVRAAIASQDKTAAPEHPRSGPGDASPDSPSVTGAATLTPEQRAEQVHKPWLDEGVDAALRTRNPGAFTCARYRVEIAKQIRKACDKATKPLHAHVASAHRAIETHGGEMEKQWGVEEGLRAEISKLNASLLMATQTGLGKSQPAKLDEPERRRQEIGEACVNLVRAYWITGDTRGRWEASLGEETVTAVRRYDDWRVAFANREKVENALRALFPNGIPTDEHYGTRMHLLHALARVGRLSAPEARE